MNKQDLIVAVADAAGLSRSDAIRSVEAVFDVISAALKRGDEVRVVGFGTFSVSKRAASTGRNPRTGEPMQIKATAQPKFRAGKVLKDMGYAHVYNLGGFKDWADNGGPVEKPIEPGM